MKSLTAVCQTGASMPPMNPNGRIARHTPQRGDGENAEMKMYLSKLKDLVPFMPKNRKLSKLEIIQHVIDYICDLQTELEAHPEIANFDAASALNMAAASDDAAHNTSEENVRLAERLAADSSSFSATLQQQQQQSNGAHTSTTTTTTTSATSSPAMRQPLADRQAPNTILPGTHTAAAAAAHTTMALHMQQQLQLQQQQWEQQQMLLQQQQAQQQQQQQQSQQQQQQQQQHQQMPTGETVSC